MKSSRRSLGRKTRESRKVRKVRKARRDIKSRKSRKKRNQNRKGRKSRKGGFYSQGINNKMFEKWKNNWPLPNDCCPCVFSFLGLPETEVEKLKWKHENWSKGMTFSDIEGVLKEYHPDYDFKLERSTENLAVGDKDKKLDDVIAWLNNNVPKGTAMVGGIQWCNACPTPECVAPDGGRHCFLIGNDNEHGLYMSDVQAQKGYIGNVQIKKWLENPHGVEGGGPTTEFLWILKSGKKYGTCSRWSEPLVVNHPDSDEAMETD